MNWTEAKKKAASIMGDLRAQFPPEVVRLILRALIKSYHTTDHRFHPSLDAIKKIRIMSHGGPTPPSAHGSIGNQNAAKPADQRATASINFRCLPVEKSRWVKAAQARRMRLVDWIKEALDSRAGN